jgi:F0F1-type ATP synthase assembly protein I
MQSQSQKPSSPITFRKAFPPSIIGLMFVQIAVIVGGLIVGAVYLGKFLDARFATRPWLTVVSFLIATFVALPVTYSLGMKAINKVNQAEMPSEKDESSASSAQN